VVGGVESHAEPSNTSYSPPNGKHDNKCGQSAIAFMNYFHSLVDPNPTAGAANSWDRTGFFNRRAYYSRFLTSPEAPTRSRASRSSARTTGP